MGIQELAGELNLKLRDAQLPHVESVEWLLDESRDKAPQGRTTLLALGFLNEARRRCGQKVFFFDHEPVFRGRVMADTIRAMLDGSEKLSKEFEVGKIGGYYVLCKGAAEGAADGTR